MRGDEVEAALSVVPLTGDVQLRLAAVARVEAEHKNDRDIQVLAAYMRATVVNAARAAAPADLEAEREAATRLLELARQDPERYRHFHVSALHLLARCDMLEPPRTVDRARGLLRALLQKDADTDAVIFSIPAVGWLVEQRDGREADLLLLRSLAEEYPGTVTAFWCWEFAATLHRMEGDYKQAAEDRQLQVEAAEANGNQQMVESARKVAGLAREEAAAKASSAQEQ